MAATFEQQDKLVTIRTGLASTDAQLLCTLLEGEGIQVFTNAEHASALEQGPLGGAITADLMVRAADWKQAEQTLAKVATMPRCAFPVRLDEDGEERSCRHCGSIRVHPYEGEVPTFIPGIRIAARPEDTWFHCLQCDSYYRDRRSRFAGLPFAALWSAAVGVFVICLYWLIDWLMWL